MFDIKNGIPQLRVVRQLWKEDFRLRYEDFLGFYKGWIDTKVYIHCKRPNSEPFRFEAPKRGNYAYMRKTMRKFNTVRKILGLKYEGDGKVTDTVFYSGTYGEELSILEAWDTFSKDYNNFMSRLRRLLKKMYGCEITYYVKVLESQQRGYPHFHLMFRIPVFKQYFEYINKKRELSYRFLDIDFRDKLKALWKRGWSDVQATADSVDGLDYAFKYLIKSVHYNKNYDNLSLVMNWINNKRGFSMSRSLSKEYRKRLDSYTLPNSASIKAEYLGLEFNNEGMIPRSLQSGSIKLIERVYSEFRQNTLQNVDKNIKKYQTFVPKKISRGLYSIERNVNDVIILHKPERNSRGAYWSDSNEAEHRYRRKNLLPIEFIPSKW